MSEEKKNEILEEKLDAEELDAVSGGRYGHRCPKGTGKSTDDYQVKDQHGNCSSTYWKEKCSATVEHGSHCWSDDKCEHWSVKYTKID